MSWTITPSFTQWTPALVSTALWLDAADNSTIIQTGGSLSKWNDKSGNNKNATQATLANQPNTGLNTLSSKNVVTFSSSKFLGFSATAINAIALVVRSTNASDLDGLIGSFNNDYGIRLTQSQSNTYRSFGVTGASSTGDMTGTSASVFRINGISTPTTTLSNWHILLAIRPDPPFSFNRVGEYFSNRPWKGDIAELVGFSNASIKWEILEGYLAWKWGLVASLPASHSYKTNPPAP